MLKHLLFLATSIIIYTSSYGQKTLSGIVTDETTKQAVPGAVVYIPEFQRSTSTGPDGKYVFENIGNGVINIQVTSIGYKSKVDIVTLTDGNSDHDFTLDPSATELEEVSVTSNYSRLPDNTPFSANTITQGEIRKYSSP